MENRHLKSLRISTQGRPNRLGITTLELLSNFPHLSHIHLECGYAADHELMDILMAVEKVRSQEGLQHSFRTLQLGTKRPVGFPIGPASFERVAHVMLRQLRELQIRLQSISLTDERSPASIKELVEQNAETLTNLLVSNLYGRGERSNFPFGMQLDSLRLLAMSEEFCESFEFIKYTPNLEKLFIDRCSYGANLLPERLPMGTALVSNSPKLALANVRLSKLTTFKIQSVVSEDDLNRLVRWFPNLTELEMFLDDKQFQIVCQNLPNLVKLEVYGDELTDEGLVGRGFSQRTLRSGRNSVAKQQPDANITSLKSLREFSFLGARLTEESVFHGFLKSESLHKIVFGTQFRTSMLGERAKAGFAKRDMEISDYSRCKYSHYDLMAAVYLSEVDWDELKCQRTIPIGGFRHDWYI